MRGPLLHMRRLLVRDDASRARRLHAWAATRLSPAQERELALFEEVTRGDPSRDRILLGRARDAQGEPFWVGMPMGRFLGGHGWITGGTGTGKTYAALALQLAVLRRAAHPCVYFDMKGEFAELLVNVVLPAIAAHEKPYSVNVRVIRPFDRRYLPLLRITRAEKGVSREVQAMVLASQLRDALGEDLGGRMLRVFLKLVALAIELDEPLVVLSRWLAQPDTFLRAATRSEDPELREYAWSQYQAENKLSIGALAARIDTFLHLPETRLALSAPSCLSFADCLESGVTVIDLGDPPAGAETIGRFWSGILIGRLARAILSREVSPGSPQVHVVLDEWQEALAVSQVEQFARLLSLARFKKVGLVFVNQAPAQVAERSPLLVRALRTNCNWTMTFRSSLEDARAMAHSLPLPEERRGSGGREELVEELTRLPDRDAMLWIRQAPFRAQRVRSPRVDLDALRDRAATVPEGVREAIRQGTVALPRADVEEAAAKGKGDVSDVEERSVLDGTSEKNGVVTGNGGGSEDNDGIPGIPDIG